MVSFKLNENSRWKLQRRECVILVQGIKIFLSTQENGRKFLNIFAHLLSLSLVIIIQRKSFQIFRGSEETALNLFKTKTKNLIKCVVIT